MAGETAHFGLRKRGPTPAIRSFDVPPRLKAMLDGAHAALAEPFRGIAERTEIVPGLFARKRTGVSLGPLLEAARSFLAALMPKQRKAACFAIDDEAWRSWSNIHPWLMRHGVCLADLDGNQRERALALLREAMSAAGYRSARDVMRLNEHVLDITGKTEEYGIPAHRFSDLGDLLNVDSDLKDLRLINSTTRASTAHRHAVVQRGGGAAPPDESARRRRSDDGARRRKSRRSRSVSYSGGAAQLKAFSASSTRIDLFSARAPVLFAFPIRRPTGPPC
jgi:hypothetical protein